jgi:TRAP-type C4-dicarboxylate transport system substrate-binding protein
MMLFAAIAAFALTEAASAQTKLTMIGSWTPGTPAADIGHHFIDEVNRLGEGKLAIEYKGAAEVVPVFDQPEAVARGLFDLWYGAPNYWAGVVPAGYITELSAHKIPDQGPGSELFDFMVKLYEPARVRYLGHFTGDGTTGNHYLVMQERIESVADLKGMKIRVPPLTRYFIEAVGAEPITLPPGDIYVALDRGTVSGLTWPYYDGFTDFGWQEVSKYLVDQPLYRDGTSVKMNLEKWNSLSKEQQEIVLEAVRKTQQWAIDWVAEQEAKQLKIMQDAGMEVITLPAEDAEAWSKLANEALWAHFKSIMDGQTYADARRLLGAE